MRWLLGETPCMASSLLCHAPGQWLWCRCWRLSTFLTKMCKPGRGPDSTKGWPGRLCRERRGPQQCTPVFKHQRRAALRLMGVVSMWSLPDQLCFTSPGRSLSVWCWSLLLPSGLLSHLCLQCLFLQMEARVFTCKFLQWLKKIR